MKITFEGIREGLLVIGVFMLTFDNVRLHRRMRIDRLAKEAEDALGPPRIGDIDMPDPSDPRWTRKSILFEGGGISVDRLVLALGTISVREDNAEVFIGDGPAIANGTAYGKRVLHAYKRRLVEEARNAK